MGKGIEVSLAAASFLGNKKKTKKFLELCSCLILIWSLRVRDWLKKVTEEDQILADQATENRRCYCC